jgi:thiosulfate/3-mercaptopyruvate sulfurtransferase
MNEPTLPLIIETSALADRLGEPELLIVDLSERQHYLSAHIPGAVHLSQGDITVKKPPVSGLVPGEEQLSKVFSRIGLTPRRHVVAVDEYGIGKAGRLVYTLHAVGHERVSLLDGGMTAWTQEDRPTEAGEVAPRPSDYRAGLRQANIADKDYITAHLNDADFKVLDVRTPDEYSGRDVRSARGGHIPGARQLDFDRLLDPDNAMRLKPQSEIEAMLHERGISKDDEVVVHCQSHNRSSHTYAALKALGYERVRGYPGSWSDWGNDPDTPVER